MAVGPGPTTMGDALMTDGYFVVPAVLSARLIDALRGRFSASWLSRVPSEQRGRAGSFVRLDYREPLVVELLTWPAALDVLAAAGFHAPRLHSFYASTKPPGADALAWHSDLFYPWEGPSPPETFLLYAIDETSRDNGCLRVVPGSHRPGGQPPLARSDGDAWDTAARVGEVDVALGPGDLFVGDRRLLHATHANASDLWRTCFTISLAPSFDLLPRAIRALIAENQCLPPPGWRHRGPQRATLDPRLRAILPIHPQATLAAAPARPRADVTVVGPGPTAFHSNQISI